MKLETLADSGNELCNDASSAEFKQIYVVGLYCVAFSNCYSF
jgi:hypothetical protein